MFLYNLKLNGNRLVKFLFIVMLLIILVIFSVSIYNIFLKNESRYSQEIKLTDTIKSDKIFEITPENYTNILQAVTEDIDSYIGCKVHFTGYVYRLIDFDKNEFVLARDMIVNENTSQSLVVGFLCTYDTAYEFKDNTWVDITGTIVKGEYYGDIAQIKVDFPNVTAVEMEATAIAQVCHAFNVPFVVVRAISDAGDGEASMSFEEFLPLAAKQSSALVLGMIDRL